MEFRSCARGRQWCGIFHYHWWTASIKPRLLFSHAGFVSWGLPFLQFNSPWPLTFSSGDRPKALWALLFMRYQRCYIFNIFSSGWAIVTGLCPSSVVVRRSSSVNSFTSKSSYLKPLIRFWLNFTGMIPGWSPTKVVQMVLIGRISRSRGQKAGFQNAFLAHLSTKCSVWAILIGLCPSSVVVRRPSCVVRRP